MRALPSYRSGSNRVQPGHSTRARARATGHVAADPRRFVPEVGGPRPAHRKTDALRAP